MHINIDLLMEFKKFRSWFRGSSEFNVIIAEDYVTFVCHRGGLTHVTSMSATVISDIPLPLGFSFYSSLFLNITFKNKGLDELRINISQNNVIIDLNGRVINVLSTQYSPGSLSELDDGTELPIQINMKDFTWLLGVSRYYKDDNIQIRDNIAFIETEDGIYYSKLSSKFTHSFSFVPALLNRAKPNTEVYLSKKLEIRTKPFRTFSSLYKTSNAAYETLSYARKQKSKIKIDMSLNTHKPLIKSLRAANFSTNISAKKMVITTKDNESLSLLYDNLATDIATNNLDIYTQLSELVNEIPLKGYPVHQLISNEKQVALYVTPYASLIKFGENSFLLLRG